MYGTDPVSSKEFPIKSRIGLSHEERFDLKAEMNQTDEIVNTTVDLIADQKSNNNSNRSQRRGQRDYRRRKKQFCSKRTKQSPDKEIIYFGDNPLTIFHSQNSKPLQNPYRSPTEPLKNPYGTTIEPSPNPHRQRENATITTVLTHSFFGSNTHKFVSTL